MKNLNNKVSCVHPDGIKTNIAKNARVNKTLANISAETAAELYDKEVFITTADDAARIIVKGIKKNQRRVMVGRDAKLIDFLTRMFPKSMVYMSAVVTNHMARKYARLRN